MALNAMMRAVMWDGIPYNVSIRSIPIPTIQDPTDAIVRVRLAGICGSDLHTYHGFSDSSGAPYPMGHEAMGTIESIGDAVYAYAVGDYVVVPDNFDNGTLELRPESYKGTYGGPGIDGCQTEYVRVPHADVNLISTPLTNSSNTSQLLDYLFVGDIFSTAWQGVSWSAFEAGDSIAIFGAGPVGLLAVHAAMVRGAAKVYSVDHVPARLERAAAIGAIPINFNESDPVEQILAQEPDGVMRCVDAVGFEAVNATGQMQSDIVLQNCVGVAHFSGGIGIIGVHLSGPGVPDYAQLPLNNFFRKSLTIGSGVVDVRKIAPEVVPLIAAGVAQPHFIVSRLIGIEEAPEGYGAFSRREEQKVVIQFP